MAQSIPFIHLRLHSAYSLAEGAVRVKDVAKLCHTHHMPAVAITDTNNLFGALEISMNCAENGIQPIVGCQLSIQQADNISIAPAVLLVKNERGYQNLLKLVSLAYLEPNASDVCVTLDDLFTYAEGLFLLSGGHQGFLAAAMSVEPVDDLLNRLKQAFPDSFYIELQRHGLAEQKRLEPKFLELAHRHHIPIVATNDVFFDKPNFYEAHDALLCIAEGAYISEENRRRLTPNHSFKSSEEMMKLFSDLPEAIENTSLIAQRCHFMPTPHKPILPKFPLPDGKSEVDELRENASEGLKKRLQEEVFPLHDATAHPQIQKQYQERLAYELEIIETMGFPGYFLIVSDFIKWAKSQGIPVGPGRGSGAGSLVAWVLTITNMDPIRFGLLFERFLNPERVSMPDFDVDFCQDRRDEVIQYVCQKYGADRVAHIITFGKLQARAVLRDVGRVLQMPYGQVDKICKLVPNNPANPVTLEEAIKGEPLLQQARDEDETVQRLMDIGIQLEGLYRHASTHAAGVVIGDRPLDELVPLYKDERSHLPATQFNMKYVETAGLLKFDFLGLKTLTVIEKCCQLIRKKGTPFHIDSIPLDDPKTFELLCRVDVLGIFQIESGGMRDVLRKLQPDRFEDLIVLVALFRPGPMDDIPRYLACKHGEEAVSYLHEKLKPILEPTYGVMVYQEQVMKIAQELGGYTLGAADLLRRAMGKKIKSEMDAQRALFVEGAVKNGISEQIASQIFDQMAKFAGYGFNKSHSAPYALLSYQTAYLKANHPLEFFAATMTYDMHNTDKLNVYRQDLEKSKIPLLPPDVNHSFTEFAVENEGVRYGLAAIKNVGTQATDSIAIERQKNGPYKDIHDFATRLDISTLNKRQLENLIAAGALDCLGTPRDQLYGGLDAILAEATLARSEKNSKQSSLFGAAASAQRKVALPKGNNWNLLDKLQKEFDALGFYLSAHPLDMYGDSLKNMGLTTSIDLPQLGSMPQSIQMTGIILSKQERTSKAGQKFAFVTFSDTFGVYEVAFFSEAYEQARSHLTPGSAMHLTATYRPDGDGYRLTAQALTPLDDKLKEAGVSFYIEDHVDIQALQSCIQKIPSGKTPVHLIFQSEKASIKITLPGLYNIKNQNRADLLSIRGIRN